MHFVIVLLLVIVFTSSTAAREASTKHHVDVFAEAGKYGGWPANHGMWNWKNEILVGFSVGTHKDLGDQHNIDRERPEHHVLARSLDGGESWRLEFPAAKGMLIHAGCMRKGITDPRLQEPDPKPIVKPIDFDHPDFCMTTRYEKIHGGTSRLYYSYDRGKNWQGPFKLPLFGQSGVMARTDHIVNGSQDCHIFLTASKSNHREGRVFCGRTTDGGLTWDFVSFVGDEPHGFSIMPSTVRVGRRSLVMNTRRREGPGESKRRWIDTWRSHDDGQTWRFQNKAVADLGEGNPPDLIQLQDGRLCLTYGVRKPPFEIQAKWSDNLGRTWTQPITLRTGGGGVDLGYTRSAQRPDGKIVTVYYIQPGDSPYRKIVATIWDCPAKE